MYENIHVAMTTYMGTHAQVEVQKMIVNFVLYT